MSVSVELRNEVLARMRDLGADRAHTASAIANHGERRSTGAVWRALERLWEDDHVVQLAHEKWRLVVVAEVQMAFEPERPPLPPMRGGFIHQPTKREMGVDAPDFGPTLGDC